MTNKKTETKTVFWSKNSAKKHFFSIYIQAQKPYTDPVPVTLYHALEPTGSFFFHLMSHTQ